MSIKPVAISPYEELLEALISAALRACSAERDRVWAEGLDAPRAERERVTRDRHIRYSEHLLAFCAGRKVISERAARVFAGHVYNAVASTKRAVTGKSFSDEPDGHVPRVEALKKALTSTWRRDRLKGLLTMRSAA